MKKMLIHCLWLTAVAAGLVACSPHQPPPAPPALKVTVSAPVSATVTNWDQYPGHIEAVEMVEVRARVAGYLDSIHFQEGAEVKAGDLLFVIDPKPFQAEMDRAEAQRRQVETRLQLAREDLRRAESLRGTKAISEEEYDTRNNAMREAEAGLAAARAAEEVARLNQDFTRVTAPIPGRIGRRLVTVGNSIQLQGNNGAATLLATIVSMDPIYCYFDVEEGAFLKYRGEGKGAPGAGGKRDAVPCEVALVNEPGFVHRGRLDFFDNQINPQTGTIRLRAVFENPDRALVPGMFANLRILAGPPEPALLVPEVAVQSDQGHMFVYVVNSARKVETRSITTGRAHGASRTVLGGLSLQDQVVVNGLMLLRPGMTVDAQVQDNGAAKPEIAGKP
jgi:RND family efflux transporter MFP subunit